jgi:hypothetical protein
LCAFNSPERELRNRKEMLGFNLSKRKIQHLGIRSPIVLRGDQQIIGHVLDSFYSLFGQGRKLSIFHPPSLSIEEPRSVESLIQNVQELENGAKRREFEPRQCRGLSTLQLSKSLDRQVFFDISKLHFTSQQCYSPLELKFSHGRARI